MSKEEKIKTFPKRRKATDNPYTLGFDMSVNSYTLTFTDIEKNRHCLCISEELYESFNSFELADLKILNEYDRHIEQSEQTESQLVQRTQNLTEDMIYLIDKKMQNEKISKTIELLPENQKRRLKLYYFAELNYEQIAKIECCTYQAVAKSVKFAENNFKKLFIKG